jgi:hypothetical protein
VCVCVCVCVGNVHACKQSLSAHVSCVSQACSTAAPHTPTRASKLSTVRVCVELCARVFVCVYLGVCSCTLVVPSTAHISPTDETSAHDDGASSGRTCA